MKIEPARTAHLARLFEEISDVSRAEADALRLTPWAIAHELRGAIARGAGDAVSDAGGLLFVLAHEPHATEPGVRVTSFAATRRYFGMGASSIRIGWRYLANLRRRHPGIAFEAHTFSPHPDVDRWFTVLGFERLAPGMYRLSTIAPHSATVRPTRA